MSRLRKYGEADLPFGIYVPSGILKNGSLIVSWATGQKATSQIDYGTDPSVPNTTGVKMLGQGDEGFVEGKDIPLLERYHTVPFPQTFVDTTHYFRVRSSNTDGKVLQSDIYSVYVTSRFMLQSKNAGTGIRLKLMRLDKQLSVTGSGVMNTNPTAHLPISAADNVGTEVQAAIQPIDKDLSPATQKTTMKTNYTITIT